MKFLRIDCMPLKQVLLGHCEGWVQRFTDLLSRTSHQELEAILADISSASAKLAKAPATLDQLADAVSLLQQLRDERAATEERFGPLEDRYALLEKFQVSPADGDTEKLDTIPSRWAAFQLELGTVAQAQENYKENFREKLVKLVTTLVKDCADYRAAFEAASPQNTENATRLDVVAGAKVFMSGAKQAIAAFRQREADLRSGLAVFKLPAPPLKELATCESDLELLSALWEIAAEWSVAYDGWKEGQFRDLKVDEMEGSAVNFGKRIIKIGRDVKGWGTWVSIRDTIEAFKRTMPLITDLRNPVLRQRHWQGLMETIGQTFDPFGESFTLGKARGCCHLLSLLPGRRARPPWRRLPSPRPRPACRSAPRCGKPRAQGPCVLLCCWSPSSFRR